MKKFKYSMLSLPRTGSNWVRYWFEYFSEERTSERNILVETNHWGVDRTEETPATLYKRHKLSSEDIAKREIRKLVLVIRDYRECFVRHCVGKKFERRIQELYPNNYIALYSMVSFSSIPYAEAWEKGMEQEKYIGNIMKNHDIDTLFEQNKVDELIHSIFGTEVKA